MRIIATLIALVIVGSTGFGADPVKNRRVYDDARSPYIIYDDFLDPRENVIGTSATPGPGFRLGDDTSEIKIIAGSKLQISDATEGVSPSVQYYPSFTRKPGQILRFDKWQASNAALRNKFMGAYTTAGAIENAIQIDAGTFYANSLEVGTYAAATEYSSAVVLRSAGAFYFNKEGGYWKLKWISETGGTSGMKAVVLSSDVNDAGNTFTLDTVKVPKSTWLPIPLVSDGFNGTNGTLLSGRLSDGLGHAEANGGSGVTNNGSNSYITNSAAFSLNSSYSIKYTTGITNGLFAVSFTQAAPASSLFSRFANLTNWVQSYWFSGAIATEKDVNGTPTTLSSVLTSYSAGKYMVHKWDGTELRVFYNNAQIGATLTVSDATLQTGTEMWILNYGTSSTFDNAQAWALGERNEYSGLNSK